MVLELLIAGLVGKAISDEAKNYKKTGEISRSAQYNANKVISKAIGRADLGNKIAEAITKSVLK